MPIPKYDEMYLSILQALKDGNEHPLSDLKSAVIQDFQLTDEEQSQPLPSRKQPLWSNRLGWANSYLKNAGLLFSPGRARFQITEEGKRVLDSGAKIDNIFLLGYASFQDFMHRTSTPIIAQDKSNEPSLSKQYTESQETPQEVLERVHGEINQQLADDLLIAVYEQTPDFFERMVIQLLKAIGYGDSATGIVTQSSRDEGIDGIIYEDKLGFNLIYVQAKKWDPESTIGRPEIQKFVGALAGQGANKGLFITTAKFSQEAIQYAQKQHTTKVVLVDGKKLTDLMIEYDFGTSTEFVYKIKRIDSDFFSVD